MLLECIPELDGASGRDRASAASRGRSRSSCRIRPGASAGSAEGRPDDDRRARAGAHRADRGDRRAARRRRRDEREPPRGRRPAPARRGARGRSSPASPPRSTAASCPGTPSTVIDLTGPEPVILRAGAGDPDEALARIAARAHIILTSSRPLANAGGIGSSADATLPRHRCSSSVRLTRRWRRRGAGAAAAAPIAITGTVSAVGGTSATLNGTVNPAARRPTGGSSTAPRRRTARRRRPRLRAPGSANVAVSKALSGLAPATTYHYRLVAKNASATTNGGDGLFTTASPPVAVTSPATGVGPATATLGGTVNPNGQPTTWYVEYGTSTAYGTKTAGGRRRLGHSSKAVSTASAASRRARPTTSASWRRAPRERARCRRDLRDRRAAGRHDLGRELGRIDEREAEREGRPERPLDHVPLRIRDDDGVRDEDLVLERRLRARARRTSRRR